MSQRITIEIKDKIATCLTELPVVCGNSDYVVDFLFDEEWEAHDVKTAIFVVNGKATYQVFAGTACPVPVIQNTLIAWVGVFAGTIDDGTLSTSTPALVKCIPCATDGENVPLPPADDVYNQITGLIEAGMLKGEQGFSIHYVNVVWDNVDGDRLVSFSQFKNTPNIGDLGISLNGVLLEVTNIYSGANAADLRYLCHLKGEKGEKGDKGDAGSVKFIAVAELPTEFIVYDAIYLVPIEGSEENRFTEYVYIDGKWEPLGSIAIQVDHSEYVKFTDYPSVEKAGAVRRSSGATGGITVNTVDPNKGIIMIARAQNSVIDNRVPNDYMDSGTMDDNRCKPICPANLDYAVMSALTNPKVPKDVSNNEIPWTDELRAKACETIGAVKKSTTGLQIYGTDDKGNQVTYNFRNTKNTKETVAGRDSNGNIQVGTAVNPTDCVNKQYLEDVVAELRAEIEALKNG